MLTEIKFIIYKDLKKNNQKGLEGKSRLECKKNELEFLFPNYSKSS